MRQEIPQNEANALSFTLAAVFLGAISILGIYGAVAWDYGWGSLTGGGLIGLVIFVWRVKEHDIRAWKIIERWETAVGQDTRPQQQIIIRSPGREWVCIENDRTRQYLFQPEPGLFAGFMREVINQNNRVQFSQRQAFDRGWTVDEYAVMVVQLQALTWRTKEIRNNAPVLNLARVDEIRDWLESLPPYPETPARHSAVLV